MVKRKTVKLKGVEKEIPTFLEKPELIFRKIWVISLEPDEPQAEDFKSLLE